MNLAFFVLFSLDAVFHLFACWKGKKQLADRTKIFLMPLLAMCVFPICSTGHFFLLCGLIFGAVGDICLLRTENRLLFLSGLAAFAVGHLFYVLLFAKDTMFSFSSWVLYFVAAVYLAAIVFIYHRLFPFLPQGMKVIPAFYMLIICMMGTFAVLRAVSGPDVRTIAAVFGTLLFIVSDTRLAFAVFKGPTRRSAFVVMLTYIVAQAAIAASFIW